MLRASFGICLRCRLLEDDILREGFESLSAWLNHGNGHMTGFAGMEIPDDAGFAGMHSAHDFAPGAVS